MISSLTIHHSLLSLVLFKYLKNERRKKKRRSFWSVIIYIYIYIYICFWNFTYHCLFEYSNPLPQKQTVFIHELTYKNSGLKWLISRFKTRNKKQLLQAVSWKLILNKIWYNLLWLYLVMIMLYKNLCASFKFVSPANIYLILCGDLAVLKTM